MNTCKWLAMFIWACQNRMLFIYCLFVYFRQKKLEKVMEEEGLKDEEVIDVVIFSFGPGMKGCVFSIKLALVPEKRLAQ